LKRPWFSIPGTILILLLVFTAVRSVYLHEGSSEETSLAAYSNIDLLLRNADTEVSLAVLPFINFTGDAAQEWLVSGQHETLINELSKISQIKPLRIISRNTVNAFKNYDKTIPELAREIDVEYLVEASVMGTIDSVTLQLRLIEVFPQETVIWAQSCSSDFTNIFKLHSDLAEQIAGKMHLEMSPEDIGKIPISRTINPEAYKAYLRGMYELNQLTPGSVERGLEHFYKAVEIDPGEPFAYAGLSLAYQEIAHGPLDPGDALEKAEAAATQAFKLDTTLAETYTAMAEGYLYYTWEFHKAEQYFLKALELNPNLALTHYHYSWALYLWGRMDEAIIEHRIAQKFDPFNPTHTGWLGALYTFDGQHEKAIEMAFKALEMREDYIVSYYVLGIAYMELGRVEEAIEAHEKLYEMNPLWSWSLGRTYIKAGRIEDAEKLLKELEQAPVIPFTAIGRAIFHASLGNKDEAFKWLNYEPHHSWTAWAAVLPEFSALRNDPRYGEFLERLNLPE
jgi:TolB-like protein/Flp pilus assembly protein TadD